MDNRMRSSDSGRLTVLLLFLVVSTALLVPALALAQRSGATITECVNGRGPHCSDSHSSSGSTAPSYTPPPIINPFDPGATMEMYDRLRREREEREKEREREAERDSTYQSGGSTYVPSTNSYGSSSSTYVSPGPSTYDLERERKRQEEAQARLRQEEEQRAIEQRMKERAKAYADQKAGRSFESEGTDPRRQAYLEQRKREKEKEQKAPSCAENGLCCKKWSIDLLTQDGKKWGALTGSLEKVRTDLKRGQAFDDQYCRFMGEKGPWCSREEHWNPTAPYCADKDATERIDAVSVQERPCEPGEVPAVVTFPGGESKCFGAPPK